MKANPCCRIEARECWKIALRAALKAGRDRRRYEKVAKRGRSWLAIVRERSCGAAQALALDISRLIRLRHAALRRAPR